MKTTTELKEEISKLKQALNNCDVIILNSYNTINDLKLEVDVLNKKINNAKHLLS